MSVSQTQGILVYGLCRTSSPPSPNQKESLKRILLGVVPVARVRLDEEVQEGQGVARRHAGAVDDGEGGAVVPTQAIEPVIQGCIRGWGEGKRKKTTRGKGINGTERPKRKKRKYVEKKKKCAVSVSILGCPRRHDKKRKPHTNANARTHT